MLAQSLIIDRLYRITNDVDRVQKNLAFKERQVLGRHNELSYRQGKVVDIVSTLSFRAMTLAKSFFQPRVQMWSRRRLNIQAATST